MISLLLFRLEALTSTLSENEASYLNNIAELKAEVEKTRQMYIAEKYAKDEMKAKYEFMQEELKKMEIANQEAVDVVINRREMMNETDDNALRSQKEHELSTELKATQIALKDAQEQLEKLTTEKLRFVDTISTLVSIFICVHMLLN